MPLTINNTTHSKLPKHDYEGIAVAALGPSYDLTLTIVGAEEIARLNLHYREKKGATDILSFPLSDSAGEIYICPEETAIEAKKFDREYDNFFGFLFIHGCAHLKGHDHSATMETFEAELRKKFGV